MFVYKYVNTITGCLFPALLIFKQTFRLPSLKFNYIDFSPPSSPSLLSALKCQQINLWFNSELLPKRNKNYDTKKAKTSKTNRQPLWRSIGTTIEYILEAGSSPRLTTHGLSAFGATHKECQNVCEAWRLRVQRHMPSDGRTYFAAAVARDVRKALRN